jgi:hypothetical protein
VPRVTCMLFDLASSVERPAHAHAISHTTPQRFFRGFL